MEKYVDLRPELEAMDTDQLAQLLHTETEKEVPDDDLVLLILSILDKRDTDEPVELGPQSEEAWKRYQRRVRARVWRPSLRPGWVLRAASLLVVLSLLFVALPQTAQAESFWDMFVRWTSDVMEFFGYQDNDHRITEYEFKTDNPGLQQVYDAVTELGVTVPVVPMKLVDGSELVQLEILEFRARTKLYSRFSAESGEIVLNIDVSHLDAVHEYQKNEDDPNRFEYGGIAHYILRNNDRWTVIWSRDNIECAIYIDCSEDELISIIRTIYDCEGE